MRKKFFISPLVAILFLLIVGVGVIAYNTNNPPVMGHSSEEVKLVLTARTFNCPLPITGPGTCIATCLVNERVAGGSCSADFGYAYRSIGYSVSSPGGLPGWECYDPNAGPPTGTPPAVLRVVARANCLAVAT